MKLPEPTPPKSSFDMPSEQELLQQFYIAQKQLEDRPSSHRASTMRNSNLGEPRRQ